jgi:GntR family transcriptional regulator, transcriptional repressor for pyruvate dehydrogenase complex
VSSRKGAFADVKQMRDASAFSSGSPLTPLNAENSSDIAANLIRGMIYAGELPPGDWLPPLRELAAHLGISVLTLRIALKSLESVGFIVTSRGAHGGTRITDINALTQCWMDWMRDKGDDIDDLWEFREVVESSIASLAAQRRTQDELRAIDAAWAAAAAESHTEFLRWNVVFHDALAEAAHSRHLAQAMLAVRRELFLPAGLMLRKHRADELRNIHRQILEAVRDRDPEKAAESMRDHLVRSRLMTAEVLEEARQAQTKG